MRLDRIHRVSLVLAVAVLAMLGQTPQADATVLYWDNNQATAGSGSSSTLGNWGTDQDWNSDAGGVGVWPTTFQVDTTTSDDLVFTAATTTNSGTVTLLTAGTVTEGANSIYAYRGAYTITATSPRVINLGSGAGSPNGGNISVYNNRTLNFGSAANSNVSIHGSAGLSVTHPTTGSGATLNLYGANDTFNGGIDVTGGASGGMSVNIYGAAAFNGDIVVDNGGTVALRNAGITGLHNTTVNGTARSGASVNFVSVNPDPTGTITYNTSGTLGLGAYNGDLHFAMGNNVTVSLGGGTIALPDALNGANQGLGVTGGIISLNGNNTGLTAGVAWSGGNLNIGNDNGLGSSALNVTVSSFGYPTTPLNVLDNTAGHTLTLTNSWTWNCYGGASAGQFGYFRFKGTNDLVVNGPVTLGPSSGGGQGVSVDPGASLTVGGNIGANGTRGVVKYGAGTLILTGANAYTGQTLMGAGTLKLVGSGAWNPVLNLGGTNLQHGAEVFDYSADVNPATTIWTLIATSYSGGLWNSGKFQCSTQDGTHGLGWADDGSSKVTVMYTLYGDTDLNGTVDGADLNAVLSNYNQSGMNWSRGDFNYDGMVDGTDLNTVLSNYNQSVSAGAAVPEPSTLLLMAAGLAGLLAYGWRKRR
jgi:fibronectin-binding autotransporter adhesin